MHEAELALQKPDERNLAAIEVGQIDAAAEDAAAAIFGMVDDTAAQNRDIARGIEGRDVDADLHGIDRGLILGVEETRVRHDQVDGAAMTLQANGAKVEHSLGREGRECIRRARVRQQHRMAQVKPGAVLAEDVRDQDPLVDLETILVPLQRYRSPRRSARASA